MKRNLTIVLISVVVLVMGFIFFSKINHPNVKDTDLYAAIPITSPIFAEINSLNDLPKGNQFIEELGNTKPNNSFLNWPERLDSIINSQSNIKNTLKNEPFIVAFDFSGRDELFPLFIKKAESNNKQNSLENLIFNLYPEINYTYRSNNYSGVQITSIKTAENKEILNYCFTAGIFLASPKSIIVEQSIRQLNTDNLLNNSNFLKANSLVPSHSGIEWYINHENISGVLSTIVNGISRRYVNEFGETIRKNYRNQAESFNNYATWSEVNLEIDNDEIKLDGISVESDSLNNFLSIFNHQEPVRSRVAEVLPANTSFYFNYAFSDKKSFLEDLENYFTLSDSYYRREEQMKRIDADFRTDFRNELAQIAKNEITVATTIVPVEPSEKTTLFIIQTTGGTNGEQLLNNLLKTYAERKNIEFNILKSDHNTGSENDFTIYKFPFPSFPGIWLGNPFGIAQANFVAVYENNLVFSSSEIGLKDYLNNVTANTTLTSETRYTRFERNLSSRSNINAYVDINRIFSINKELFSTEFIQNIKQNEEFIRKIQFVNWQVSHNFESYSNLLVFSFNHNTEEEAETTWQSSIGSSIKFKPKIVTNHNDPSHNEIIFQDELNNLHLVNADGNILWTTSIGEPILSEIYQIDYYKNGRLQYFFNTKTKLYLIDRNGTNVADFPVELKSPASNGVSVFDYDNNRNYRYFIACEDKKIYVYDYSGQIVSGWEFDETNNLVTTPVQHFIVENRDYIVFKDKTQIYILDRRGSERVNVATTFENSNNPLVLNLNGTPKIVNTDINGSIYYIYFDGIVERKKSNNYSGNHYFTVDDLNGDDIPDFVFVDGKELDVVDENDKKLYSEKFDNSIENKPNLYIFAPDDKKVGIVDSEDNKIYLFNPDGKLEKGFPLQGSSEFSIGKLTEDSGSLNLLVGSKGGNLFNYTLN